MYLDLLTRIKNAQKARKEFVKVPYSNMDMEVVGLLEKYKFIDSAAKKGRAPKRVIEIKLKYEEKEGAITGMRFLSKPSRKLYSGYKDLRPSVKQGFGIEVVSTSKGIMSTRDAKKNKIGGQKLFQIW